MSHDLDISLPWLDALRWDADGLIPAIAQDAASGKVLMLAWMNREALRRTVDSGVAVYFSRSRQKLWQKGEESGNTQRLVSLRADCDGDALLLIVEQQGGIACHTGRQSCFFHGLADEHWQAVEPVLKDPKDLYR
ncbi:MAG: phosphoribosyl-AMP cyclohydrolase [Zoogloeaceae bacterium]|jgi:phosphoribosyl-AMP cyclohydrolase|nr:phosphoribosyl-AMP cyclohydrolase [Zoogloeaceae bacterium]